VRREETINLADHEGNTPLPLAARFNQAPLGLLLLTDGRVNPCAVNRYDQTARSYIETQKLADSLTVTMPPKF
jgi:ankyrin repeat protein